MVVVVVVAEVVVVVLVIVVVVIVVVVVMVVVVVSCRDRLTSLTTTASRSRASPQAGYYEFIKTYRKKTAG
jgi:heme/copper-type cytochrome/quinol oxidase subunit 2